MFWLSLPVGGKSKLTNRENLDRVAKAKKVDPVDLYKLPTIDESFLYLLSYFNEVKGNNKLTWQEVKAWNEANELELSPEEYNLLFIIDEEFCRVQNDYERRQSEALANGNK